MWLGRTPIGVVFKWVNGCFGVRESDPHFLSMLRIQQGYLFWKFLRPLPPTTSMEAGFREPYMRIYACNTCGSIDRTWIHMEPTLVLANVTNHSITPSHTSSTSILEKMQRQLRQPCLAVGRCSVPLLRFGKSPPTFPRRWGPSFRRPVGMSRVWGMGLFSGTVKFAEPSNCFLSCFGRVCWKGLFLVWTLVFWGDEWNPKGSKSWVWGFGGAFLKVQNAPFGDSAVDDVMMFVKFESCMYGLFTIRCRTTSNAHAASPFCLTVPCFLNVQHFDLTAFGEQDAFEAFWNWAPAEFATLFSIKPLST